MLFRLRAMSGLAPSALAMAQDQAATPRPIVFATFHLALWESQTWLKLLSPVPLPDYGIIFRPLDNPAADRFVKETRERYGMKLLSRKAGFAEALGILRAKGAVGILIDQNAGNQGALTLFFGRAASTTELPGVMAEKFGAEVRTFYPRRTGFWRVQFESDPVPNDGTADGITVALNAWLEGKLSGNAEVCACWLWAHDRWRTQDVPQRRLRLEAKRNLLPSRYPAVLPKNTRLWIRMPNWLGDVVMAVPLIRAIRASRPDAEITLVAKASFTALLEEWDLADRVVALPPRGIFYYREVARLRGEFPDTWILLTNSFRGDLEAWLSGARQRFGIVRPGKRRPLLSDAYVLPAEYSERSNHQLSLWTDFLKHFGLAAIPDRSPLAARLPSEKVVGLIAGSENNPEKRWPVAHWRSLIESLPECRFILFGTPKDAVITREIAAGFPADRIEDLAGKTTLSEYGRKLRTCELLVTNDTGGMHLANALGVPLIGLFGPTNPVRTGPVFSGPVVVLQPDGCPATGGAALAGLSPKKVSAAVSVSLGLQISAN